VKRRITPLVVCLAGAIVVFWISRHTYWTDVEVAAFAKGEALTNPFYATQRFGDALDARTIHDRRFAMPPANAILVLSGWNWSISNGRRSAIEQWVESGGRLVVDRGLTGDHPEFEQWSGIVRARRRVDSSQQIPSPERCDQVREEGVVTTATSDSPSHWICDFDALSTLGTTRSASWSLIGTGTVLALRISIGKGSVTVLNGSPFRERSILNGDHGWLFVAATQLHRGDEVHFLSEELHPSLVALIWRYGQPLVILGTVLIGFLLWRDSLRFGPLAISPTQARRSLAEQIRGTGRFTVRYGGGEALHAACARALEEAATRRISGYQHLNGRQRAAKIAELAGLDRDALNAAVHHPALRQSNELRNTIEMLETARRALMHTGPHHGTS